MKASNTYRFIEKIGCSINLLIDVSTTCPDSIGLPYNHKVNIDRCGYPDCETCWKKALDSVEDFEIKWKFKENEECVHQ